MSEENVEIVRRQFEAFQARTRGDEDAPSDDGIVDPDAEWVMPPTPGFREVYKGREGFDEFLEQLTEDFDWTIDLERVIDAGDDQVVAVFHQRATAKASGVPVEVRRGLLYDLKDGRIVRFTNYLDPADALKAAGLSE